MNEEVKNKIDNFNLSAWLGQNIIDIAIVLICIGYVMLGLLKVIDTGKTPSEILFDGAKSLITGFVIARLMKMKGILSGEKTPQFLNTRKAYGNVIDEITPYIDKIQGECDQRNEKKITLVQTRILRKAGIPFETWFGGNYEPKTKEQKKAVAKASNVKIKCIDTDWLLCDVNDEKGDSYGRNKKQYISRTAFSDVLTKVLFAVIGGMYSVELIQGIDVASLLWDAFQVVIFLGLGAIGYIQSYMFINDEYRTLIIQKTNILTEILVKVGKTEVKDNGIN